MFHKWWFSFSAFFLLEYEVGTAQCLPLGSNIGAKAQICSHIDEINGLSAIWRTNCTIHVSFVLNVVNYPPIGGFWVGIGFKLLSDKLALVEVVNEVLSISSAKYYEGQPSVKSTSNVLLNPYSAIFPGNILEATFPMHESLLNACKEWTFFTIPTPIGLPYASKPIHRMICNVGETCSRNNCIRVLRGDYILDSAFDYGRNRFYDNNTKAPPLSQLMEQPSSWPISRSRRSPSTLVRSQRLKRQTAGGIFYPNRFKGTAYEGQDAEFVREPQPYYDYYSGYYGKPYNNPNYWTAQRDDVGGAMYYPYRTLFTRRDNNANNDNNNYYYDANRY